MNGIGLDVELCGYIRLRMRYPYTVRKEGGAVGLTKHYFKIVVHVMHDG